MKIIDFNATESRLLPRRIVNSIVTRLIKSKLNIDPSVNVYDLYVETVDDKINVRFEVEMQLDQKEVFDLIARKES